MDAQLPFPTDPGRYPTEAMDTQLAILKLLDKSIYS